MNPFVLRVLLAADTTNQAAFFEHHLREAGHEVVVVEARGDVALKAARLVHPDVVVLSSPLRGTLDGADLANALHTNAVPVPVLSVTDPTELPDLLAQQALFRLSAPTEQVGNTES